MPTADRYARYREDQTTVWISKRAATFISKERTTDAEGSAAILDRLLIELRSLRKASAAGVAVRQAGRRPA